MRLTTIFFYILFIVAFHGNSQKSEVSRFNLGIGLNGGVKSITESVGFILDARYKNVVSLTIGTGYNYYKGVGGVVGLNYHFSKWRVQPFIGSYYGYYSGNNFYKDEYTIHYVSPYSHNFIVTVGAAGVIYPDVADVGGFVSIKGYLTYRYTESMFYAASGNGDSKYVNKVNHLIGKGIGFGVSIVYFIF